MAQCSIESVRRTNSMDGTWMDGWMDGVRLINSFSVNSGSSKKYYAVPLPLPNQNAGHLVYDWIEGFGAILGLREDKIHLYYLYLDGIMEGMGGLNGINGPLFPSRSSLTIKLKNLIIILSSIPSYPFVSSTFLEIKRLKTFYKIFINNSFIQIAPYKITEGKICLSIRISPLLIP